MQTDAAPHSCWPMLRQHRPLTWWRFSTSAPQGPEPLVALLVSRVLVCLLPLGLVVLGETQGLPCIPDPTAPP